MNRKIIYHYYNISIRTGPLYSENLCHHGNGMSCLFDKRIVAWLHDRKIFCSFPLLVASRNAHSTKILFWRGKFSKKKFFCSIICVNIYLLNKPDDQTLAFESGGCLSIGRTWVQFRNSWNDEPVFPMANQRFKKCFSSKKNKSIIRRSNHAQKHNDTYISYANYLFDELIIEDLNIISYFDRKSPAWFSTLGSKCAD